MYPGGDTSDDSTSDIAEAIIDNTTGNTARDIGKITSDNSCNDTDGVSGSETDSALTATLAMLLASTLKGKLGT